MEQDTVCGRNSLSLDLAQFNLGNKPKIKPRRIKELLELSSDDESEDKEHDSDQSDENSDIDDELECEKLEKNSDNYQNVETNSSKLTNNIVTNLETINKNSKEIKQKSPILKELPKNETVPPQPLSSLLQLNQYSSETPIKQIQISGSCRPNPCNSHKSLFITPQSKIDVDCQKNSMAKHSTSFAHFSQNNLQTPMQNQKSRLIESISTEKSNGLQSSTSKVESSRFYNIENKKVRRPLAETMMPVSVKIEPKQSYSYESRYNTIGNSTASKIEVIYRRPLNESNIELKENNNPNLNEKINDELLTKSNYISTNSNKDSIIEKINNIEKRTEISEIPKETGQFLLNKNESPDVPQLFNVKNEIIPQSLNNDVPQFISKNEIQTKVKTLFPTTKSDEQIFPTVINKSPKLYNTVNDVPQFISKNDVQTKVKTLLFPTTKSDEQLFPTVINNSPQLYPTVVKNETPKIVQQIPMSFDSQLNQNNEYINVKKVTYRNLGIVGKGMSGQVYRVQNLVNNTIQAIKFVDFTNLDTEGRQGCIDEIKLLHKLQAPCVIKMFDYEVQKTHAYVVMELGDTDLSRLIKTNAIETDIYFTLYYWRQMLIAVDHIHKSGVIHSDLKPGNFVLVQGKLKIIDFGISSSINADMTSVVKNSTTGTLNYISPEALTDIGECKHKINCKSDVWSLGCILYSLVYGHTPFNDIRNQWTKINAIQNPNHKINFPQKSGDQMKIVPTILIDVMKKCLNRDPKARPTVKELLDVSYISNNVPISSEIPTQLLFKILNKQHNEEEGKEFIKILEELRPK